MLALEAFRDINLGCPEPRASVQGCRKYFGGYIRATSPSVPLLRASWAAQIPVVCRQGKAQGCLPTVFSSCCLATAKETGGGRPKRGFPGEASRKWNGTAPLPCDILLDNALNNGLGGAGDPRCFVESFCANYAVWDWGGAIITDYLTDWFFLTFFLGQ